ncbi:hypothetical protein Tco_1525661 [Tanacetum coccineum]
MNLKSLELLGVLKHTETWIGLSDMDAVRVCLLLVVELVFMGKEDKNCIPRHLVSLVEDFDSKHRAFHLDKKKQNPDYYPTYNLYGFPLAFKIWILESYPNSKKWWSKKDNVLPRALAWSNVTKFGKNNYNSLLGPDSNPNLELYATPVEQQTEWFKASIEYINGLVDLDMNVSEDDIGGDVSNNSFDLNDNVVSGNGNNDVLLLEGGDGFVDSVESVLLERKIALVKVDDARIEKLERILNDNFIPCNDRSKGNHNAVNPGLTTSANHPLSTCSRHVVDNPEVACAGTGIHNPARNNDSLNSNHNVVYKGLYCSANDRMSSCFSPEMPNDEVVVAGTAIHLMHDRELNTCCPEMHNAKILVVGMGIDKADENIYNPNANDNLIQTKGIAISFNAHMPDGHNDNPNANDNDVNQGIDPMVSKVVVAGMEIDKGDGNIDIPTASDNDVNLAKFVSVNDLMKLRSNVVYEGMLVYAKEAG